MKPRADVLSRILVLQSMLRQMPDEEAILEFLCQGLKDVPGVEAACHDSPTERRECKDRYHRYPLKRGGEDYGDILSQTSNEDDFAPYDVYMQNLSFMVAVVLEERRLRKLSDEHKQELERNVRERTKELLAERQRAERYLKVSKTIIVELDRSGAILVLNKRGQEVLEYELEDVTGRNWFELVVPVNHREAVQNVFDSMMREEIELAEYYDNDVLTRSGRRRHIAWHNVLRRDEAGAIIGTLSSGLDITARKHAEDRLSEEKELLSVTLRSIGDGVITTDTEGRVVNMNRVAEELTGWVRDDATGVPLDTVMNLTHEFTGEAQPSPVETVLQTGQVVEMANHTVLTAKDGTRRPIADSGAPIRDRNSEIIGVVLVFRDMTEKQKLVEQAQRAEKLDSLGILAGGIAHDFNNLLGGIFGHIELARQYCNPGKAAEKLDKALSVHARACDLTQQLLTFSKGGAPQREVGSIAQVLHESVSFALSGSKVACRYAIPRDLWACHFDRHQIAQVIDNVVINAKQAMPGGGTLGISAENEWIQDDSAHLSAGRYVKLQFSDTGVGIPREVLGRIFDPFFTTKSHGNGLGLATCYSILQQHDGYIEVESEPGKETTFTLHIPATDSDAQAQAPAPEAFHHGQGMMVIMDDEEFIREVLSDLLEEAGYTAVKTADGDDAIEACNRILAEGDDITGIFLDLTVPGGRGGLNVVGQLRSMCPDVPIFASSGYSGDPAISRPEEFGFTASIRKPYRLRDLDRLLRQHMNA